MKIWPAKHPDGLAIIPTKSAVAGTIIACDIAVVDGGYRCLFRASSDRLLQGIEACLDVELSGRRLCRLAAWQSGAPYAGAVDRARSGVRSIPALSRFLGESEVVGDNRGEDPTR
jgi:hypothetical protein